MKLFDIMWYIVVYRYSIFVETAQELDLENMKHILAIDDDEAILSVLHELIEDLGYDAKVAHNGEEGLELYNNGHNFDLVITDINMPLLDGNEVARHI